MCGACWGRSWRAGMQWGILPPGQAQGHQERCWLHRPRAPWLALGLHILEGWRPQGFGGTFRGKGAAISQLLGCGSQTHSHSFIHSFIQGTLS